MDVLIKNATVLLPKNGWNPCKCDITVGEGGITLGGDKSDAVLDGSENIYTLSFANAHTHLPMTLLRGTAEGHVLERWLPEVVEPIERNMRPEDAYAGALLGCAESIAGGSDRVLSTYFFPEETARAMSEAGLGGHVGISITDSPNPWSKGEEDALSLAGKLLNRGHPDGVKFCLAPHSIYRCSDDALAAVQDLSQKHDVLKSIHVSETRWECVDSWKRHGRWPVEHLHDIGFLDRRTVIAHSSWLTKMEIPLIRDAGASVVHCPTSNMKLASGAVMPLVELLEANVRVLLGTDSPASNNTLSMPEEMKFAALVHKAHRWDASAVGASSILDMATAHSFYGRRGLVGFRKDDIRMKPSLDNIMKNHIVYSSPRPVELISGGKVLLKGGEVATLDMNDVLKLFDKSVEHLYSRAGVSP